MELAQKIFSNLFPSRCILCRQTVNRAMVDEFGINKPGLNHHVELCADCYERQPFNSNCCVRCALPLAIDNAENTLCGRCITSLPDFDYAYSLFRYEDDIIGLVHQLKFSEKITYARSIGELLLSKVNTEPMLKIDLPDCLLPVPLHVSRLRQRGFNQSIEIARIISKKLKIPMELNSVIRQRSTESQTGLNAKQRKKNIKGAFSVTGKINYRHVLIIDDVMTTGSTVNELASLLKKNKVERVGVLSIARAPVKG
jgi:ComF family protein